MPGQLQSNLRELIDPVRSVDNHGVTMAANCLVHAKLSEPGFQDTTPYSYHEPASLP